MATYAIGTYGLTVAITGPVADPRNFAETATLTIVGGVDIGVAEEFSGYTEGSIRREYALGVATETDEAIRLGDSSALLLINRSIANYSGMRQ